MRTLTQSWLCLLVLGVASVALATTIYVDDDAPNDPGPGNPEVSDPDEDGSADHPYDAIQEGIDDASDGDEVVVAAGTYTGVGNRGLHLDGKEITVRSADGPTMCVLDLDANRGFDLQSTETPLSVIDGFGFRNGTGGAIRCIDSSPAIESCLIWSCGSEYGAGILCIGSSPAIENCVIWSSSARFGGGIACLDGSSPSVVNCLLWSNATHPIGSNPDGGGGIYSKESTPTIVNCTIVGNSCEFYGGGIFCDHDSGVLVANSIVRDNSTGTPSLGSDIAVHAVLTLSYTDAPGAGTYVAWSAGADLVLDHWIDADPLFVTGPYHDYYLSQTAAGQEDDSPCVDAGSDDAVEDWPWLYELTTRTDSKQDSTDIDMGYHAPVYIEITDVYWDQVDTEVVITFTSEDGIAYDVQAADADEYSDSLNWMTLTSETASGDSTTVTDDLSTNPLDASFRFYRIKRQGYSHYSRQTAGVFELPINASTTSIYFISTPLVPDADHDSVPDVFGENDARQIVRQNFTVSDLDESNGAINRMRNATGTYSVLSGSAFDIEAGVGYELYLGLGFQTQFILRLTGYVPESELTLPLIKENNQATRWMGYSMPRAIKLSELGLVEAVTPSWASTNTVSLLPSGSPGWFNYRYDTTGGFWYDVTDPGVEDDPDLLPGMGIVFLRYGFNNDSDELQLLRWYLHPPNTW
jgi:hypothetical protein